MVVWMKYLPSDDSFGGYQSNGVFSLYNKILHTVKEFTFDNSTYKDFRWMKLFI